MGFKRNLVRSWGEESDGNEGEGEVSGDWKGNDEGEGMGRWGRGIGDGGLGDGR